MINLDTPINNEDDDIFNFKSISEKIAENIKSFDKKESLTISIEGEWGNGKTSLSNLICNKIKKDVVLMHFNPWMIVDFTQLSEYFFSELIKELVHENFDAKLKEDIIKDLKKFASIFTPNSFHINTGIFRTEFRPKETLFAEKEESLYKSKEKLNTYLSKLSKKIVIVIDDIDRLTNKETETFFRLIKGIADFNNIIYLLLYDKDVVSESLKEFKKEKGEKYLDKIVQYSITVPKPHKYLIKNELFKRLDKILNEMEAKGKKNIFDEYRWSIAMESIDVYIKNLRDINKITSILTFEYPLISEDVNFVDFFVITLIKIQNIKLYNSIKDNPTLYFANTMFENKEDAEKRIIDSFEKEQGFSSYKNLLSSIFPAFREYGLELNNPHKEKYIANNGNFENYFSFDVSPEHIKHSEYSKVVFLLFSSEYDEFYKEIINLDTNRKSSLFVDMFFQKDLETLELSNEKLYQGIINVFKVVNDVKEGVFDKHMSFLGMNPSYKYFNLVFELLLKIQNDENIMTNILTDKSLLLADRVDIVRRFVRDKHTIHNNIITDNLISKIELTLKIELSQLSFNDLLKNKFAKILLYRMKEYGLSLENISYEFNKKVFNSKKDFFEVLEVFKYWQQSSSGNKYLINKELMEDFFTLEDIDNYINNLDTDINSEEKDLLNIYKLDSRNF